MFDLLSGRRDSLTPPTRLMFEGTRDISAFKKGGEDILELCTGLCELKPKEKILDVGCGIGRKTVPLTGYLNEEGWYEGFDIVKAGIHWCKENISTRYPNFHFQLIDIYNRRYNPKGRIKASELRFPFEDESFDLVVLVSVFTHMLPEDVENYFSQIARVLKKGGRCLITYFLLTKESLELINAKKSLLDFKYDMGKFRTINLYLPEDAVCYDEVFILSLYEKYGLKIKEPVLYGWCQRPDFLSHQDVIIATKI